MGGGQGTTTTSTVQSSEPWSAQKPYLEKGFEEASQLYDSSTPQYFPFSTTVPWSPETEAAMSGQTNRALYGSPVQQAANENYADTLSGNYLSAESNPYLQSAIGAAVQPLASQFTNTVMPALKSTWSAGGRYGSPGQGFAEKNAADAFLSNVGNVASSMAYQNYGDERSRQAGLIPGAPAFAAQDYNDFSKLGEVGQAWEGQQKNELQDLIDRFNFEQNKPATKIGQYMSVVGDKNWGGTTTGSATQPYFKPDPLTTAAGIALGGAGAASKFIAPTMICAELYEQGLMDKETRDIDQTYGRLLMVFDPALVAGYHRWAPYVVRAIRKSRGLARCVAVLSSPVWTEFRARLTGGKGSLIGKVILAVGGPPCRFLGKNRPLTSWEAI